MLGKLLKYELQSILKRILPLYIALFGVAIFFAIVANTFIKTLEDFEKYPAISILFIFIIYALVIALSVVTIITIVNRFRKALLGSEGYLMFTLPVSVHTHLISKLVSTFALGLANSCVLMLSFFVVFVTQNELRMMFYSVLHFEILRDAFMQFSDYFGVSFTHLIAVYTLLGIVSFVYFLLTIYFSLAVGHLSNKSKFVRSFLVYIGINIVLGTVFQVLFVAVMISLQTIAENMVFTYIMPIMYAGGGVLALLTAGFYFATWYILKNKLNLE